MIGKLLLMTLLMILTGCEILQTPAAQGAAEGFSRAVASDPTPFMPYTDILIYLGAAAAGALSAVVPAYRSGKRNGK